MPTLTIGQRKPKEQADILSPNVIANISKAICSTKINLSNKFNINSTTKDESKKSSSKINDNKVTNNKKSKTANLKTLKKSHTRQSSTTKVVDTNSSNLLKKKNSAKSRIKMLKAKPQTI